MNDDANEIVNHCRVNNEKAITSKSFEIRTKMLGAHQLIIVTVAIINNSSSICNWKLLRLWQQH